MQALEMMLEAFSPLRMLFVGLFPNATWSSAVTGDTMVQAGSTAGLGIFRSSSPFLRMIVAVTHYGVLVLLR